MTDDTAPKLTRTSISRIETFAACPRYDYYQVVEKLPTPPSPYKDAGTAIHEAVESQFLPDPAQRKPLLGAAARAMRYYPAPDQDGVEVERKFDGAPYAGALLYAKIDCHVPPGDFRFGGMVRAPKRGLARILDLKTTASKNVRYKEDPSLLDTNRQLLAYVRIRRPADAMVEVAQVVVGRDAPHASCGPVRIVSQQQAVDQEGVDSEIVPRMVESRRAPSALELPPAAGGVSACERWYGKRCDFYDRCHGSGRVSESVGVKTRSWGDILESADQDGRGGEGTRGALEQAVRETIAQPKRTLSEIVEDIDSKPAPYAKLEDDPFWSDKDVRDARESSPMRAEEVVPSVERVGSFSGEFRFLSNFYPCLGSSVEHAYQAAKCVDPDDADRILTCPTSSGAKRIGRQVALRPDWEGVRTGVMLDLVRQKFRDPDLRRRLLATGGAKLVEGNAWGDSFWGFDWQKQEGRNELGKILMRVREELQREIRPSGTDLQVHTEYQKLKQEESMSLVNPSDANQAHTSATLVVEGPVQVLPDTMVGKPYCSIIGTRHGQPWEFRALLDDCKFLVGGESYDFTRPDGRVIQKVRNPTLQCDGTFPLKGIPANEKPSIFFVRECSVGGKQDIDLIRKNALHPLLLAWDAEVAPPAEEQAPRQDPVGSALDEIESQQRQTDGAGSDTAAEIQKLRDAVGCTELQAERMVAAGITDARFRAGQVTQQEIEALPKFGKQRAEDMLERYRAAVAKQSPAAERYEAAVKEEDAYLESISRKDPETSAQPSEIAEGLQVLRDHIAELEGIALARKMRIDELELLLSDADDGGSTTGYTLYVDCLPVQGARYVTLEHVLRPYLERIASDRNVVDVLCLKAFEWPGLLVEALHADAPSTGLPIVARSQTKEWDATRRFFLDRASVVVQGIR